MEKKYVEGVERFSAESCPMNGANKMWIALANMSSMMAIEAYKKGDIDKAMCHASDFDTACWALIMYNSVDYIVFEIDEHGYPQIKLDGEFGEFTEYRYYYNPQHEPYVEEKLFDSLGRNINKYWPGSEPPLVRLVDYTKAD